MSLTIRLVGRNVHLVRDAHDCDTCTNHAEHVPVDAGLFLQSEIKRAVQSDALGMAEFRDLAETYGLLNNVHRVIDAKVLDHVAWLLETKRLIAIECVSVRPMAPPVPATGAPMPPRRRPPPPVEDPKTWVEIELLFDTGKPVVNQRYRITVPGGVVEEGHTDSKGRAKLINLDPGMCDISFPDIEAKEWKKA
jgi:hypothetical protein